MDPKKYRKILYAEADWIYNQLSMNVQDYEKLAAAAPQRRRWFTLRSLLRRAQHHAEALARVGMDSDSTISIERIAQAVDIEADELVQIRDGQPPWPREQGLSNAELARLMLDRTDPITLRNSGEVVRERYPGCGQWAWKAEFQARYLAGTGWRNAADYFFEWEEGRDLGEAREAILQFVEALWDDETEYLERIITEDDLPKLVGDDT